MENSNKMYEVIQQGLVNTHADSHSQIEVQISNMFSIEKASAKMRVMSFEKLLHNKILLWHGVQQTSLANTLREGLKVPQ